MARAKTHGGPRNGAGRKALTGSPMKRYQVMLDAKTVERLKSLGDGNLSSGARMAAALWAAKFK